MSHIDFFLVCGTYVVCSEVPLISDFTIVVPHLVQLTPLYKAVKSQFIRQVVMVLDSNWMSHDWKYCKMIIIVKYSFCIEQIYDVVWQL